MKKVYFLKWAPIFNMILVVLFFHFNGIAQTFTNSNLPIVSITTDTNPETNQPLPILDDPRILASMKIIQHPDGSRNDLADSNTVGFLNYNGRITIEIRGSSSQDLPKKSYGLTTLQSDAISENNVSLLGMPKENDWVLNSLAFDPSLIRDYLSYNLSRQMGNYAPRTEYCEVIINGEYQGLYLLQEKIKADSNRVNIVKIATSDVTTPNVTGGYIIKADKTTGDDPVAWTMSSYAGETNFINDFPKPENITTEQNSYIYGQFLNLESTSTANSSDLINGYPSVIDVPSFIDFMISNELSSNADGYQLSTYFHKDRDGKLRAGPIWDFNLTYGNDLFQYGFDRSKTDVWQFTNGDNEGAKFWTDLFNNATFKCYLSKRWHELTSGNLPLKYANLLIFIDNTVTTISEAIVRENARWGTIPNPTLEIEAMKQFLFTRINWMTDHIGSFSECTGLIVPALVIDKINYNPGTSEAFPVSNDLEFIEIKNTQTSTVTLTGIYFKELGITYSFPANATIAANQSIYLASNPTVFQLKYGLTPFGKFTRNLSNNSQKLVLVDAFGNTIDSVEYLDEAPWPDADGNGRYLRLISTSSDNSLASSWEAFNQETLSNTDFSNTSIMSVYPNPVSNELSIQGKSEIHGMKLYDVLGNLLYASDTKASFQKIDFTFYPKGIYLLRIFDATGTSFKKIVKQ